MEWQTCYLTQEEVEQVVRLLATTDLRFIEIAIQISCSEVAVSDINRKRKVRDFGSRFRKRNFQPDSSSTSRIKAA